jgi:hypothetical protein
VRPRPGYDRSGCGDAEEEDAPVRGLRKFESKLEEAISGMFARAFRSAVQPVWGRPRRWDSLGPLLARVAE